MPTISNVLLLLLLLPFAVALCAPGGNFDLSRWNLQLPSPGPSGGPKTVAAPQLVGCGGYQDAYFFRASGDGALVMKVPGSPGSSGCVTTPNSQHCRTELREVSSWSPWATTNQLSVRLAVVKPDNSGHGTVIGQIHIDDKISTKPVCELFYSSSGEIVMGVEQTIAGGNMKITHIANVPVGRPFNYKIAYQSNVLSVTIDGARRVLSTNGLGVPTSYFKVGNYNQGTTASSVHFLSIHIDH